jgi:hypothetical protein
MVVPFGGVNLTEVYLGIEIPQDSLFNLEVEIFSQEAILKDKRYKRKVQQNHRNEIMIQVDGMAASLRPGGTPSQPETLIRLCAKTSKRKCYTIYRADTH